MAERANFSHQSGQFSSVAQSCDSATPWITTRQSSLSITNSQSLLKLMSIESVMPSSHLILCHPFSFCPQSLPASGPFLWLNSLHEVLKVLEFQLQLQSFQWTPRTDLLYDGLVDLLAVQGTLKSLLQHHSSEASPLRFSALFIV